MVQISNLLLDNLIYLLVYTKVSFLIRKFHIYQNLTRKSHYKIGNNEYKNDK